MTPARDFLGERPGAGSGGREPADAPRCAPGARSWWRRHREAAAGPRALVAALLLALVAFVLLSGAENPADGAGRTVALSPARPPEPLWLIFVDSLSDRVALDAGVMPELAALRARGASFTVEPCRDRLTYRCLHAALTGKDASAPLALRANFVRERGGSAGGEPTLLHLASQRGRVVAAGAHDLESYDDALDARWYFPGDDEDGVVDAVASLGEAQLAVVGLSQGDRAAHAHSPGSAAYRAAFGRVDRLIGELVRRAPPDAHVVVFGDHGHDAAGHHLPGGEATTFAVYAGPAVTAGASARLALTDHRALLGVLLGLPTPALYQGPPLDQVLRPSWLAQRYGGAPELRGHPRPALGRRARLGLLAALGLGLAGALVAAWRAWSPRARPRAALALVAAAVALRAGAGYGYEAVCVRIHDHGDSPGRAAWLLVPLGAALLAARALPGDRRLTAAALLPLVPLLLLFSSANYYGAGRAVVPAAGAGLALLLWRLHRAGRLPRLAWPAWAAAAAALALFYDVRRIGSGGSPGYYELRAALLGAHPAWALAAAQGFAAMLLLAGGPGASRDRAAAGGVLTAGAVATLAGGAPLGLAPALVAAAVALAAAGAPATALAAGWLALGPLYRPAAGAGLGVLLAGVMAALEGLRLARLDGERRATAGAVIVAVAAYLALWPAVGMRLAGIDFGFAFRWVPVEQYEAWWWAIALATAGKLALPFALLGLVAREAGPGLGARLLSLGAAKTLAVAVFAASWSLAGPLTALAGQEALDELALTLVATASLAAALGLGRWLRRARRAALSG